MTGIKKSKFKDSKSPLQVTLALLQSRLMLQRPLTSKPPVTDLKSGQNKGELRV